MFTGRFIVYLDLNKGFSEIQDASELCFDMFTLSEHGIAFVFNFHTSGRLGFIS